MRKRAIVAILVSLVACGSSSSSSSPTDAGRDSGVAICGVEAAVSPGSSTVTGTLGGQSVAFAEVVGFVGSKSTSPQGPISYAGIALTSVGGACAELQGAHLLGEPLGVASAATMTAMVLAGDTKTIAPGTYSVGTQTNPPTANAVFSSVDARCASKSAEYGASGSITLTEVTCTEIAGTFDIQFVDPKGSLSDHVRGSFSAPVCSADLFGSGDAGVVWAAEAGTSCAP